MNSEKDRPADRDNIFSDHDSRKNDPVGEKDGERLRHRSRERSRERIMRGRYEHRDHNRGRQRDSKDRDRYPDSRDRDRRDSHSERYRHSPQRTRHDSRDRDRYRQSGDHDRGHRRSLETSRDRGSNDRRSRERSQDSREHGRHGSRHQGRSRSRSRSQSRHRGRSRSRSSEVRSQSLSDKYLESSVRLNSKERFENITTRTDDGTPLSEIGKARDILRDKVEVHRGERERYGTNEQIQVLRTSNVAENIPIYPRMSQSSLGGDASKDLISPYADLPVPKQPASTPSLLSNTKPLKSILKSKGKADQSSADKTLSESLDKKISELCHSDPQTGFTLSDFSRVTSDAKAISGGLFPAAGPVRPEKTSSASGLPGMSSYMDVHDIEDEEKFLYGDDDHQAPHSYQGDAHLPPQTLGNYPLDKPISQQTFGSYTGDRQPSQQIFGSRDIQDLYNKTDPQHLKVGGNLELVQESHLLKQEIPEVHKRNDSWESQVEGFEQHNTDGLLNIPHFDKSNLAKNVTENPSSAGNKQMDIWNFLKVPTAAKSATSAPTEIAKSGDSEKEKHDPTIENILKSIGFDFEMSKRIQNRAKSKDVPVEQVKPDESQFGINMNASFLGSGLAVDDLKPSFGKKGDVDQLIKETKENVRHVKKDFNTRESQAMKFQNVEQQFLPRDFQPQNTFLKAMDFQEETRHQSQVPPVQGDCEQPRGEMYDSEPKKRGYPRRRRTSGSSSSSNSSGSYSSSSSGSSSSSSSSRDGYSRRQVRYKKQSTKPATKAYNTEHEQNLGAELQHLPYTQPVTQDMYPPTVVPVDQTASYAPYSHPPLNYVPVHPEYTKQPSYGYDSYAVPGYDNPNVLLPHEDIQTYDSYYPGSNFAAVTPRPSNLRELQMVDIPTETKSIAHSLPVRDPERRSSERKSATRTSRNEDTLHDNHERVSERKATKAIRKQERIRYERDDRKNAVSPIKLESREITERDRRSTTADEPLKKKLVLTPREYDKLSTKREKDKTSLKALEKELQTLRKQQNEIMRKQRRQRGGHKDPVLLENTKLQDEITTQVTKLRKVIWESGKVLTNAAVEEVKSSGSETKSVRPKSEEIQVVKNEKQEPRRKEPEVKKEIEHVESQVEVKQNKIRFEFYDPGNHWCRNCNLISGNIYEVFQHLQSKKHQQTLNPYDRPWMPDSLKNPKQNLGGPAQVTPMRGVEFMIATEAFYCSLCDKFSGDAACAEEHLKCEAHYEKYQKYLDENPFYERRYNLDKAAGVSIKCSDRIEPDNNAEQMDSTQGKREKRKAEDERQQEEYKRRSIEYPVEERKPVEQKRRQEKHSEHSSRRSSSRERSSRDYRSSREPDANQKSRPSTRDEFKPVQVQGFGKFDFKKEKEEKKKELTKEQKETEDARKSEDRQAQDKKGKIAIKLTGISGIKPAAPKPPPPPKNPITPTWKPTLNQEEIPLRKAKPKAAKPASSDKFLSSAKSVSIPVPPIHRASKATKPPPPPTPKIDMAQIPLPKQFVTPKVILHAFSGKHSEMEVTSSKTTSHSNSNRKATDGTKQVVEDIFADETDMNSKKSDVVPGKKIQTIGMAIHSRNPPPLPPGLPPPLQSRDNDSDKTVTSSTENVYGVFFKPKRTQDADAEDTGGAGAAMFENEDAASQGSSMDMGSDFEIVDECNEDTEP